MQHIEKRSDKLNDCRSSVQVSENVGGECIYPCHHYYNPPNISSSVCLANHIIINEISIDIRYWAKRTFNIIVVVVDVVVVIVTNINQKKTSKLFPYQTKREQ
jgi:hypothetical protein